MNWKYHEPKFNFSKNLPSSWWGHVFFAHDLVRNTKPKKIVELGTHYGVSFLSMCQAIKDASLDTELNAVDTWQGDPHAKIGYEEKNTVFNDFKKEVESNYKELNIKLHRKLFDDAVKEFADESIDILHIDGFHTYEVVKHDFETWLPKLRKDGIVLFHDIHEKKDDFGVYKLWKEIKKKYSTIEFYHWHGLGVLFLSDKTKSHFIEKEDELKGFYNNISEKFFIEKQREEFKSRINLLETKLNQQINEKKQQLKEKNQEILAIKSSKFWKMREKYMIIKNKIFGK